MRSESADELDRMIDDVTAAAFSREDETEALLVMIEDEIELPFAARIGGREVAVHGFQQRGADIMASCTRGKARRRYPLASIEPAAEHERPNGWEWIEAYRRWWSRHQQGPLAAAVPELPRERSRPPRE